MQVIELQNERLRFRCVPQIGGSVTDFSARLDDDWVAIMRPTVEPLERASNAASFTLAPYSNRLRDGRFVFEGRTYQLQHAAKHAIAGDVRDRPWQTLQVSDTRALLGFDSTHFDDVNFPFPFTVQVAYGLDGSTLHTALTLTNTGTMRMPAGGGFHPYFNRALAGRAEHVEIELGVAGVYPAGNPPLPTGPIVPLSPEQDFHRLRRLDVVLDHCFGGWDGRALLRWPASGVRLRMEANDRMRHVIIYSPPGPVFALEPVVNANDGFNLMAQGQRDTGVVVLEPGDSFVAAFTLSVERDR